MRASLYTYVPAPSDALRNGALAGFIGRQVREMENAGPENLFARGVVHKTWKASFLAIDTNPGAQVVAIEKRPDVGASKAIVEAIIEVGIRTRKSLSWHTDVEYIVDSAGFWDAAKRYRGEISEIAFTFHPPNGIFGFEKFKEFDRIAKDQTNSEQSQYVLKNENKAIEPTGEFIESAVEYASEGAGQITMKSGRRKLFSSESKKKTKAVPESVMPREGEATKVAGATSNLLPESSKDKKQP